LSRIINYGQVSNGGHQQGIRNTSNCISGITDRYNERLTFSVWSKHINIYTVKIR